MKFSGVMDAVSIESSVPMGDWKGVNATVFGMGRSGRAAADLLLDQGSNLTLLEEHPRPELEGLRKAYEQRGARVCIGGQLETVIRQTALLVVSPGVSQDHEILERARENNVTVIGEIELAARFLQAPIIAVTGTNGKSTTVRLIGSLLQESGKHVFVGGNLGIPLCEAVPRFTDSPQAVPYDYIVAEVSSFQLETIKRFKPWIAVLLNVTPDHLDRHATQEEYRAAKKRIFENQTDEDWMVINADDSTVKKMARDAPAGLMEFSLCREVEQGTYLDGTMIHARMQGKEEDIFHRNDIHMPGDHNIANAMAAMNVGLLCRCSKEAMMKAFQHVPPIEHALESVRIWQGIMFINDSKGTNVDATLNALKSFHEPVVLILGGKDKGGDFRLLLPAIQRGVKSIVVIGEAAPRILTELSASVPMSGAGNLEDAVAHACSLATSGDVVLFSPACSSFDMFENYHQRGLAFKRLVQELR